jgi:undecaprenyl-diphosphatase
MLIGGVSLAHFASVTTVRREMSRTGDFATETRTFPAWLADVLLIVLGGIVLFLSSIPVHARSISSFEKRVFRAVNDLPSAIYPVPAWIFMQLGNFLIVPVTVLVALVARRFRLAGSLAVAGVSTYVLAKVVKHFVERGRPEAFVPDVEIRGAAAHGLGYVSGHAAVICALAVAAWPHLGRTGRTVAVALAGTVCVLRVYVGAHLPLDIVGGIGLGIACGGLARLVLGTSRSAS